MSVQPQAATPAVTTAAVRSLKGSRPIVVVTAYDAPSARLADEAGVDVILVGDSLGNAVLGYDSTLPVTMDDMLRHTAAVARGANRAMVVGDMPFMSYQVSRKSAVENAGRFLAEAGATAVKLEGGANIASTVRKMVQAGIPVMGHVGLTPQSVHALGGYRVQAKEAAAAQQLLDDCRALEDAGTFAVVLECIPAELAEYVSREIGIPTIGIGAGVGCDGQVQVFHDLLGYGTSRTPKHAHHYAEVGEVIRDAIARYAQDVRASAFPREEHCTRMDPDALRQFEHAHEGSGTVLGGD